MPELPEVEAVRRLLLPAAVGMRVQRVAFSRARLRAPLHPRRFKALVVGASIDALERRGKYLIFDLSNGNVLLAHLGMSGIFLVRERGAVVEKHTHCVLDLGARELHYNDPRRFGLLVAYTRGELYSHSPLARLGLEPLSPEFTCDRLRFLLSRSSANIKSFLLDQRKIAGLGNIYSSEVLFRAGISPLRRAFELDRRQSARLYRAIVEALDEAVRLVAVDSSGRFDWDGPVAAEGFLQVVGREGEPCPRCGITILRVVQGNRSTYFCPACQR